MRWLSRRSHRSFASRLALTRQSGACLTYLAEKYGQKYIGSTVEERAEVLQWLCCALAILNALFLTPAVQLSGVGPAQGQANWFIRTPS